jgi:hypothetical protein
MPKKTPIIITVVLTLCFMRIASSTGIRNTIIFLLEFWLNTSMELNKNYASKRILFKSIDSLSAKMVLTLLYRVFRLKRTLRHKMVDFLSCMESSFIKLVRKISGKFHSFSSFLLLRSILVNHLRLKGLILYLVSLILTVQLLGISKT